MHHHCSGHIPLCSLNFLFYYHVSCCPDDSTSFTWFLFSLSQNLAPNFTSSMNFPLFVYLSAFFAHLQQFILLWLYICLNASSSVLLHAHVCSCKLGVSVLYKCYQDNFSKTVSTLIEKLLWWWWGLWWQNKNLQQMLKHGL